MEINTNYTQDLSTDISSYNDLSVIVSTDKFEMDDMKVKEETIDLSQDKINEEIPDLNKIDQTVNNTIETNKLAQAEQMNDPSPQPLNNEMIVIGTTLDNTGNTIRPRSGMQNRMDQINKSFNEPFRHGLTNTAGMGMDVFNTLEKATMTCNEVVELYDSANNIGNAAGNDYGDLVLQFQSKQEEIKNLQNDISGMLQK